MLDRQKSQELWDAINLSTIYWCDFNREDTNNCSIEKYIKYREELKLRAENQDKILKQKFKELTGWDIDEDGQLGPRGKVLRGDIDFDMLPPE